MGIVATSTGNKPRELIPAGNYIARCISMLEIGTVTEEVLGEKKVMKKCRLTWELPTEMKIFNEEKGEQPLVISKEYTLSMHEKSKLRQDLKSWRGKDFTEEQAKSFDITVLLSVPCMLNVIHKVSKKDPSKIFEEIAGITPMPKGIKCPDQINPTFMLSYSDWDVNKFNSLPDFIKNKMVTSEEYKAMTNPAENDLTNHPDNDVPPPGANDEPPVSENENPDDLPF